MAKNKGLGQKKSRVRVAKSRVRVERKKDSGGQGGKTQGGG